MKTISMTSGLNAAFKQYQLLPALTVELLARASRGRAACSERPQAQPQRRASAAATANSARLPGLPRRSRIEAGFLALLTLSALACVTQVLVMAVSLAPQWVQLQAWIAQLLG